MNIQLKTIEEVETFIANANTLLGYPDGKGTETYCNVPEETIIPVSSDGVEGEEQEVFERYFEIPITSELNYAMIQIATEKLLL